MKVIGFCGLPGSGKSTVLKAIEDIGVIITMGDIIRNETRKRSIEPTDENLGKIAQELRDEFGPDIIAEKCVAGSGIIPSTVEQRGAPLA